MENENHKLFLTFIFLILSIIFLLLITSLLWQIKKTKSPTSPSTTIITTKASPTQTPVIKEKGSLTLKVKNNQTFLSYNNPITLYLYASSNNQPISGYDAIINYNQQIVDFINHKNLQPDFQVFIKKDNHQLIITGIKNLNSTQPTIFDNTSLLELTFQPKTTGSVDFSFEFIPQSKKESNLITEKTEDILGKAEGIKLYLGEELTLTKNQEKALPDGKLTLKLIEIVLPDEKCRDCITSAKVEVKKDKQIKEIEFKTGGIVGYLINQGEAFGYQFKLENLEKNSIQVVFFK